MSIDLVTEMCSKALFTVIKTAAPILLVSLVIGLIISVFQTVTSIQEQPLTSVPKIVSVFLALMLMGEWMLNNMTGFMTELWSDFSVYIR